MHYFFSIQNNYYTFQTVILHLINLYNYVCVCVLYYGDHHDSDRMAVLVWSSRLAIIVFVNTTNLCIGLLRVPILESNVMSGPEKIRSRGSWSHIVSKATDA